MRLHKQETLQSFVGKRFMHRLLLWMAAFLPMLVACGQNGPASGPTRHTALSGSLSELRSQFNADAGKERAIFLAAPT